MCIENGTIRVDRIRLYTGWEPVKRKGPRPFLLWGNVLKAGFRRDFNTVPLIPYFSFSALVSFGYLQEIALISSFLVSWHQGLAGHHQLSLWLHLLGFTAPYRPSEPSWVKHPLPASSVTSRSIRGMGTGLCHCRNSHPSVFPDLGNPHPLYLSLNQLSLLSLSRWSWFLEDLLGREKNGAELEDQPISASQLFRTSLSFPVLQWPP